MSELLPNILSGFSTLPLLLVIELVAIMVATRIAERTNHIVAEGRWFIAWVVLGFVLWGSLSASLALNGFYQSDWFRASWPAFWVTFIPVLIVMVPLLLSRTARDTVRGIVDATPLSWTVGFHALRLCAIGGVLKGINGEFSRYYGIYIGIPDFLYGLSALAMLWLVSRQSVGNGTVILWHLIGAAIIVPFGIVLLQMGLPGPWQYFDENPGINVIFDFPMALAPTLVVPIFVMTNLFVALRLIERSFSHSKVVGA